MVRLLARLRPIEEKIIDLLAEKSPILDAVQALRKEMVRDCVHPYQNLSLQPDGTIKCKFCERTLRYITPK